MVLPDVRSKNPFGQNYVPDNSARLYVRNASGIRNLAPGANSSTNCLNPAVLIPPGLVYSRTGVVYGRKRLSQWIGMTTEG